VCVCKISRAREGDLRYPKLISEGPRGWPATLVNFLYGDTFQLRGSALQNIQA
jgi:hypothetical protein